jgi:hypothetical protein
MIIMRRCRFQNLVLGGGFLELQLEPLIFFRDRGVVLLQSVELGFEVLYVTFFAFAECSLAVDTND